MMGSRIFVFPRCLRSVVRALAIAACTLCAGCATLFFGPNQEIRFYSTPPGAKVQVTSRADGQKQDVVAPGSLKLRRKHEYDVTFSKPGYQEDHRSISKRVNIWYILDYIYYIVPGIVDTATGSGWILEPSQLAVALVRDDGADDGDIRPSYAPARDTAVPKITVDRETHPHRNATAAILTFDARTGVSADEAALLADRFSVELGRTEVYRLISRSKMKEVLELQEYSVACTSVECAVEAGQLLGVEYMIYGSIGRIGSLFTINVYITSVEKGSVIAGATADHYGEIEGLLTSGMPRAVNNLLKAVCDKATQ